MVTALRWCRNMLRLSRLSTACVKAGRTVVRVIAWIPVVFVAAVLLWGYYVYVYIINISGTFPKGPPVVNVILSIILLVFGHIIFALQLTSYLRTIFTSHKPVPEQFTLTEDQIDRLDDMDDEQALLRQLAKDLPVRQRSRSGGVRYCDSCDLLKPDRTHHCSMCNRCVLKMDHHCPWVNNCVGWSNYKFFVLFLFYTMLLCVYLATTSLYAFIGAWNHTTQDQPAHKFQVIFFVIIAILFGLSTSTLLIFHIYLSVLNRTTLENMAPPVTAAGSDRRLYHLGVKENLKEVFGSNLLLALLPVATSPGDGVSYKTKSTRGNIEMGVVTASSEESDSEHDETHPLTTSNI